MKLTTYDIGKCYDYNRDCMSIKIGRWLTMLWLHCVSAFQTIVISKIFYWITSLYVHVELNVSYFYCHTRLTD